MAIDELNDRIYVAGLTNGLLDGRTATDWDPFIMAFDLAGNWAT